MYATIKSFIGFCFFNILFSWTYLKLPIVKLACTRGCLRTNHYVIKLIMREMELNRYSRFSQELDGQE